MSADGPRSLWARLSGAARVLCAPGLALAGAAALAVAWGAIPSFWPFETFGRIYVESPEVYTRERLVNDRYAQDFWLRAQLAALDNSDAVFRGTRSDRLSMGVAPADPAASAPATAPAPADAAAPSTPDFASDFLVRMAIRDRIRQSIIENFLDDRHDLTGNTVFGFKFDTSVLPGTQTHRLAYVSIRAKLPEAPAEPRLEHFVLGTKAPRPAEFAVNEARFATWIRSIDQRLNTYGTEGPCQTGAEPDPKVIEAWRAAVIQAFSDTLNIAPNLIEVELEPKGVDAGITSVPVYLPHPWGSFLATSAEIADNCRNQPRFTVRERILTYTLMSEATFQALPATCTADCGPLSARDRVMLLAILEGATGAPINVTMPDIWGAAGAPAAAWTYYQPSVEFDAGAAARMLASTGSGCPGTPPAPVAQAGAGAQPVAHDPAPLPKAEVFAGAGGCATDGTISLREGFFNFARAIAENDPYVYAVLPKEAAEGYFSSRVLTLAARARGTGPDLAAGFEQAASESATEPVQLSFSLSDPAAGAQGRRDVQFGWVIGNGRSQQPTQKSQLVLVSLPAYLDRATFEVTTGWLNRAADPDALTQTTTTDIEVSLPPDYEALDTLVARGKQVGPAIFDTALGEVTVRPCAPAQLVIPGARLWRSAAVTLGGQMADSIEVLPNMMGIVARFQEVAPQAGIAEARLAVWTSEGVDWARSPVRLDPPTETCPP